MFTNLLKFHEIIICMQFYCNIHCIQIGPVVQLIARLSHDVFTPTVSAYQFLLLACYVPNVAKRSMRSVTTDISILKISNGHISARGRRIHFMFGYTVGFSRSADRMALFFRFDEIQ